MVTFLQRSHFLETGIDMTVSQRQTMMDSGHAPPKAQARFHGGLQVQVVAPRALVDSECPDSCLLWDWKKVWKMTQPAKVLESDSLIKLAIHLDQSPWNWDVRLSKFGTNPPIIKITNQDVMISITCDIPPCLKKRIILWTLEKLENARSPGHLAEHVAHSDSPQSRPSGYTVFPTRPKQCSLPDF